MPVSPSIVLLKGKVLQFTGKKIIAVSGNSKIDQIFPNLQSITNKKVHEPDTR